MKDYLVTHGYYGTAQFTPRIVRAENAKQALEAVLSDMGEERSIRKLPKQDKYRAEAADGYWETFEVALWTDQKFRFEGEFWKYNRQDIIRLNHRGEFVRRFDAYTGERAA